MNRNDFLESLKVGDEVGAIRNTNYALRRSLVRFGVVVRTTKTLVDVSFPGVDEKPIVETFSRKTGYEKDGSVHSSYHLLPMDEAKRNDEVQTAQAERNNAWTELEKLIDHTKRNSVNGYGDVVNTVSETTKAKILELLAKI